MLRPSAVAVAVSAMLSLLCAQDAPAPVRRNASGGVLIPEQAAFDVRHYELRLAVDPEQRSIEGTLTMRAQALAGAGRLALDLDEALTVRGVAVDGTAAAFEHRDGRIWIDPATAPADGSSFTVAVTYGGTPRVAPNPPWVGGFTWSKTKDGKPWIATSCQGEGADLWWPCKDHPSDKPDGVDLFITVPDGLICASNGVLKDERRDGKRRLFHWQVRSPISNYCVALNIAPYEVLRETHTSVDGAKVPVAFYVLPEHKERAAKFLPQFVEHLAWFEQTCGPYPFRHEKYGVAETPHLGMEHQSIIAYGNRFTRANEKYDWLHHHELAHEWWGNLITCKDWSDMWLHEGLGTYMQPLYLEHKFGKERFLVEMRNQRKFNNRIAVAPRRAMSSAEVYFDNGGSNDIYFKGSWVAHTLRWQLGDEKFRECLQRFCYPEPGRFPTDGSQVRLVTTDDFVQTCNKVSGQDLGWFFEVYVRQPALPDLHAEKRGDELVLEWDVPGGLPFPLAVPVAIGGKVRRVELPDGKATVPLNGKGFEVDPDGWVLRR